MYGFMSHIYKLCDILTLRNAKFNLMNKILYIFLLLGGLVFAQNPNDFEKIVFEYNHKHEYGTNKGIFSKEEFFELTKSNNGNFILKKTFKL